MIGVFKRWVAGIVHDELNPAKNVPQPVTNGAPFIQVYKIGNGYIVYKSNGQYRDDGQTAIYCATPLDVARQIINGEALEKLGIQPDPMQTTGYASAKLGTQTN